ncbi:basic helix-loop-helix ARNT-like protein 2 isoform X3 [Tenrec ecaudatus]|uniref:basic helix-loop-helix ARNT-like protein 2 isoform X3 n=1 Tax=Tenrec ecaudatus TaxID=94439 RepID=UPI003F5A7F9C
MAAEEEAAAGDKVPVDENRCMTSVVSRHLSPGTTPFVTGCFSSHATEFPRKRKGNDSDPSQSGIMPEVVEKLSQNPVTFLLSTRIGISASSGDRLEGGDHQVKMKSFREAHSQTEKRRRDKMNNLIEELSLMIPQCKPVPSRKLDKLTVLRMAVQHLKSLKGMTNSFIGDNYRPSFIQDSELRHLILKTAEGFLFVVGCERGKILFVSKSVSKTLNYDQASLTGQSLFDFLHPKDVAKVKEQLSSSGTLPRETLVDANTGLQVRNHFHTGRTLVYSGSRRSFFCRIRGCKVSVKEEHEYVPSSRKKEHRKFYTVYCTGYLRSWPPDLVGLEEDRDPKKDSSHFTCLVAIGRLHPAIVPQHSGEIKVKPTEFVTRFTVNGKFVYVDQRVTAILGYLPQELLGTSCYEYFHQDDCGHLTGKHKAVLQSKEKIFTDCYKFRAKDGSFVTLKSQWFSFTNPWTKELEYIVSVNTLVLRHGESGKASLLLPCGSQSSEASSRQSCRDGPAMPSGTVLGAGSTGTDIAHEFLDLQRLQAASSLGGSSPTDLMKEALPASCRNVSGEERIPLSPETGQPEAPRRSGSPVALHSPEPLLNDGAQLDFDALCDNDETAMAAFMNYFEAEGGLGDPADFSDIQWTL